MICVCVLLCVWHFYMYHFWNFRPMKYHVWMFNMTCDLVPSLMSVYKKLLCTQYSTYAWSTANHKFHAKKSFSAKLQDIFLHLKVVNVITCDQFHTVTFWFDNVDLFLYFAHMISMSMSHYVSLIWGRQKGETKTNCCRWYPLISLKSGRPGLRRWWVMPVFGTPSGSCRRGGPGRFVVLVSCAYFLPRHQHMASGGCCLEEQQTPRAGEPDWSHWSFSKGKA